MATSNLKVIRGDDTTITLTFTNSAGAAINLTGATVYFTVKDDPQYGDDKALISKDVTVHTNAAGGITSVVLSHTDTDIQPGIYFWDVQIKAAGTGNISSASCGDFEVVQDITRRTT
jgi:hypothetical protein